MELAVLAAPRDDEPESDAERLAVEAALADPCVRGYSPDSLVKRILFRPAAVKVFESLHSRDRDLVEAVIDRFASTGKGDLKMLAGMDRHMRLRAGD